MQQTALLCDPLFVHGNERPAMLDDGTCLRRFDPRRVVVAQADRVYCTLRFDDGQRTTLSYPLGRIEGLLPAFMVRVSRSYMVNVWHVERIIGNEILMSTGERIVMGSDCRERLLSHFCLFSLKK